MCLKCDEPLLGPGAFRIRIGAVTYDSHFGALFCQDPCDHFNDETKTKWLCPYCAEQSGIYIDELLDEQGRPDRCMVRDGGKPCFQTFEDVDSEKSESVLLVEWGQFCQSEKGPGEMFITSQFAHVHFVCACDGWGLPLWSIPPRDCP